jgi:hypothetical protein
MEGKAGHSRKDQHAVVREKYDEVQSDGRYEEGMATTQRIPRPSSATTSHWRSPAMAACCAFIREDSRRIES